MSLLSQFYPNGVENRYPERAAVWKTAAVVAIIGNDDEHDHRYHYLHDSRHAHHRTTPTPHHHHAQQ